MSLNIRAPPLASNDDFEEDLLLMDTDGINLQLDEQQPIETNAIPSHSKGKEVTKNNEHEALEEEHNNSGSFSIIEKLKVYIRDGPNRHHVEKILVDEKYYELPTAEQLAAVDLTEEKVKEIWESLDLSEADFRSSTSPAGSSRPESLYVRGVNNMSTQEILNCFEEFQPVGIEWISDQSCNLFWHDALSALQLLAKISTSGPTIARVMRSSKRKRSSSFKNKDTESVEIALTPGRWREIKFDSESKTEIPSVMYVRYTTLDDRKMRGAENQSEYYRQYGNPNYNNMTGLISRSKKRALNAMRTDRFRDFTVVKSDDPTAAPVSAIEEIAPADDDPADPKVSFTVILPPKKASSITRVTDDEDEDEHQHRSKRQRRRSPNSDDEDADVADRRRKDKTHFTVTIDPSSKHTKDLRDRFDHKSTSKASARSSLKSDVVADEDEDDDADDDTTPMTDARQILERKRRNRR